MHFAVSEDITRTFDATNYKRQGFADTKSDQENSYIFTGENDIDVMIQKTISKTTIKLFDFAWLDTTDISTVDFGTEKQFYQVETVRNYAGKKGLGNGNLSIKYVQDRTQYS